MADSHSPSSFFRVWRKSAGNGFSDTFLQNNLFRCDGMRGKNTIGMEVIA